MRNTQSKQATEQTAEQKAAIAQLAEALAACEKAGVSVCATTEYDETRVWRMRLWSRDLVTHASEDGTKTTLVVLGDDGAYESEDVLWDE